MKNNKKHNYKFSLNYCLKVKITNTTTAQNFEVTNNNISQNVSLYNKSFSKV
jgi:hypothetical protein